MGVVETAVIEKGKLGFPAHISYDCMLGVKRNIVQTKLTLCRFKNHHKKRAKYIEIPAELTKARVRARSMGEFSYIHTNVHSMG